MFFQLDLQRNRISTYKYLVVERRSTLTNGITCTAVDKRAHQNHIRQQGRPRNVPVLREERK